MKFKFFKSLRNDYILLLALLGFVFSIGLIVFFEIDLESYRFINIEKIIQNRIDEIDISDALTLIVFGVIMVISLICFIRRLCYIKSFAYTYQMVKAQVVYITPMNDRFGIDVEFMFEGELCKKHFALMKSSQTKHINLGSALHLHIKDCNPKNAIIADLYFE